MKARKRWGWLLVVGVLGGIWWTASLRERSVRTLYADGWEIRLMGVSYGRDHFGPPQRWNRVKAALPRRLLEYGRVRRPLAVRFRAPQLVVWLEVRRMGEGGPSTGDLRFEWAENDGLSRVGLRELSELEVMEASGWSGKGRSGGWQRLGLTAQCFPRRARALRLAVSVRDGAAQWRPLGALAAPNPVRQEFPRWQSDGIPASREVEGLRVDLERFAVEPLARSDGHRWARAVFGFWRGASRSGGWGVGSMVLSDPTGNQVPYGEDYSGQTVLPLRLRSAVDEAIELEFPWLGSEGEPVWEIVCDLIPIGLRALDSGDPSKVLSEIPAPSEEGVTWIDSSAQLGEFEIRLLGLVGAHASIPGREHDVFGQWTLELELPPLPAGWQLAVLAADEHGAELPPGRPLGDDPESVGLKAPAEVRLVDLGLMLFPERQVRFRLRE